MTTTTNNKKHSKQPRSTQLTDIMSFSADPIEMKKEILSRLIIEPPVQGTVPNSNPTITFYRFGINIRNLDKSEGGLIINLDRCFSFGTGESKAPDTGKLNGYSTSISMYDRDGATERQLRSVEFIEQLTSVIKDHLLTDEIKEAIDDWDLTVSDLKKINPLYYKKGEKGKILKNEGATFYPKLKWYPAGRDTKKNVDRAEKMITKYYSEDEVDDNGNQLELNPLDFQGVRHYITPAVEFASIFIGKTAKNLQCKIYEAEVKAAESGAKRLLKVQSQSIPTIIIGGQNPLLAKKPEVYDDDIYDSNNTPDEIRAVFALTQQLSSSKTISSDDLQASDDEAEQKIEVKKSEIKRKKVSAVKK